MSGRGNSAVPDLHDVVAEIADEMRQRPDRGEVATYIPELARVDPQAFGLAVVDADGNVAAGGRLPTRRSRSRASPRSSR